MNRAIEESLAKSAADAVLRRCVCNEVCDG